MAAKVYLETTIVSYLVATPSADLIQAAHQEATRHWWARRHRFELFVSRAVVTEARRGAPDAAARRLEALRGKIEGVCRDAGTVPPIICTPEELMEPTS